MSPIPNIDGDKYSTLAVLRDLYGNGTLYVRYCIDLTQRYGPNWHLEIIADQLRGEASTHTVAIRQTLSYARLLSSTIDGPDTDGKVHLIKSGRALTMNQIEDHINNALPPPRRKAFLEETRI